MTEPPLIDDPLAGAVVRMRRVTQPEAPFAGWLARVDETVVQLVDTADLRGWPGWRSRGDHVLGVQDVLRTSSGHEAVLPWCIERVDTFLARREEGGADLGAGEVITIAVSLIRGCGTARGETPRGDWWLTQDGTPTFVCAADGAADPIGEAAGSLVDRLSEISSVDGSWRLREIARMLRDGRDAAEAEAHLFAIASPEPLVLTPLTPRRAADARRAGAVEVVEPERRDSLLARLVRRHVDSGIGDMVSDAMDSVRRRAGNTRRRVARPWLVAVGIAGVIVVGGLAWPTGSTPAANARPAASESPAPSTGMAGPGDTTTGAPQGDAEPESADGAGQSDPAAALQTALESLATCADAACAAKLFEESAAPDMPPGAVDLPAAERRIELLDDLGGVAILSVSGMDDSGMSGMSGEVGSQLVVLVRTGESWVIRDVRDVEAP
ncbi:MULTISPECIES: hypothetical protein [Bacteria]|jgi:hypothetical protein